PPLQGLRRYYEPVRQRVPRRYSAPRGSAAWGTPCRTVPGSGPASVRTRLLLFHAEAADRARVVYMPDTTWPVSGHPPGSSRSRRNTPVPMSSQSFGTSATIRSRSPSRSPPDASTDAFSSSLTTTVFSQRSMRRLEASLRRATPKGHETFISRTAPHQGPAPTSSPPRVQDTLRHAHCRGAPQDAPNCAARSTCALTPNRPRVVQDPAHRAALPTQPACRHARRQHRQIRQGSAGHDWPDP